MIWQPIETAPKDKKVLAAFKNEYGKWRRIIASYYSPGTLSLSDDDDPQVADENGFNTVGGWYEESETHDFILPCRPTHWQALPKEPKE